MPRNILGPCRRRRERVGAGVRITNSEGCIEAMNEWLMTCLRSYLQTITVESKMRYPIRRCMKVVSNITSEIDINGIHFISGFGHTMSAEVRRRVTQPARRTLAARPHSGSIPDAKSMVVELLKKGFQEGVIGEVALNTKQRHACRETYLAMQAFVNLLSVRDIGVLRPCSARIAEVISTSMPAVREPPLQKRERPQATGVKRPTSSLEPPRMSAARADALAELMTGLGDTQNFDQVSSALDRAWCEDVTLKESLSPIFETGKKIFKISRQLDPWHPCQARAKGLLSRWVEEAKLGARQSAPTAREGRARVA